MSYHQFAGLAQSVERGWKVQELQKQRGRRRFQMGEFVIELSGRNVEQHSIELMRMLDGVPQMVEGLRADEVRAQEADREKQKVLRVVKPMIEGKSFDPSAITRNLKRLKIT